MVLTVLSLSAFYFWVLSIKTHPCSIQLTQRFCCYNLTGSGITCSLKWLMLTSLLELLLNLVSTFTVTPMLSLCLTKSHGLALSVTRLRFLHGSFIKLTFRLFSESHCNRYLWHLQKSFARLCEFLKVNSVNTFPSIRLAYNHFACSNIHTFFFGTYI